MAIIKCPECGKDISNSAYQCPGCGYPLKPPPLPKQGKGQGLAVGCVIAIAVAGVFFIISILVAIAIPSFLQYRKDARRSLCINNQRLLDHAKEVLAIKNNLTSGQVIAETDEAIWKQLDPFIDGTNVLHCPAAPDKHYIYGAIDTPPQCPVAHTYTEHVYAPR